MDKILFVATVDQHIRHFHYPFLKWFKENGYEVHVASKGNENLQYVDRKYNLPFERQPFNTNNIKSYKMLKKLINENDYKIVHCHTPVGGVIARLASISARKKGMKVIYTAHGFHFFKGAPKINWMLYYPAEKIMSRYTDVLITINQEDYDTAVNKKFKAKQIELVNGVGIDLEKFTPQTIEEKNDMRNKYGYKKEDFILFYAAELNNNKHQDLLINVINKLREEIPSIKLLLAGNGPLEDQYKKQAKELGVNENIEFLGYRKDVKNFLMLSDLAVASSRREGLPANIMEAMAIGLPIVATNVRGHRDLIKDGENGYVVEVDDEDKFISSINEIYNNYELREKFKKQSLKLIEEYSLDNILIEMERIYKSVLEEMI